MISWAVYQFFQFNTIDSVQMKIWRDSTHVPKITYFVLVKKPAFCDKWQFSNKNVRFETKTWNNPVNLLPWQLTICTVGKVVISNKIHFDQVSKIRQKHYDLNTVSIVVNKMGNKIRTEKRKGKIRESRCLLIIIICNPLEGVGSSSAQWDQNTLEIEVEFIWRQMFTV